MSEDHAADELGGRVLGGTYRLEERIGAGGMGTVYRAQHVLLGEDCAVKVVRRSFARDDRARERFLREARTLTRLRHPRAVHIRHLAEEEGLLYLAMDLCSGETLRAVLDREAPLPETRAVAIAEQILDALSAAHAQGIVHRDLKPENVMVETRPDGTDRVRVLDFGLARLIRPTDVEPPGAVLTEEGAAVGTVLYMSPEQIRARSDVGPSSDIFSLGVMLYEMLAGGLPFKSDATFSVMMRIIQRPAPPLPAGGPSGVSEAVRSAVARALEKRPEDRHPDAASFGRALLGESGARRAPPAPAPPPPTSRRWLAAGGGALAVAGAAFAFFLLDSGADPEDLRAEAARLEATCAPAEAIRTLQTLVDQGAATPADHLELARMRTLSLQMGAVTAIEAAEASLGEAAPEVLLAWAHHKWRVLGDTPGALEDLQRAIIERPGYVEALSLRANIYLGPESWRSRRRPPQKQIAEAARDIHVMERRAPAHPLTAAARARLAAIQAGEFGDSEKELALAEEADRATRMGMERAGHLTRVWLWRAMALGNRADALRRAGRGDEGRVVREAALDVIERGLARLSHPDTTCERFIEAALIDQQSRQLELLGRGGEAAEAARRVAKVRRGDDNARLAAAHVLRRSGFPERAIPIYQDVLDATNSPIVHFDLGNCHFRIGLRRVAAADLEGAVRHLGQALSSYETSVNMVEHHASRAAFAAYQGEARLWLSRLRGQDAAGTSRRALGDLEKAARDYGVSAAENGRPLRSPEIEHRRAEVLAREGRWDEALADLSESIDQSIRSDRRGYLLRLARLQVGAAWHAFLAGDMQRAAKHAAEAAAAKKRAASELAEPASEDLALQAELAWLGLETGPPDEAAVSAALDLAAERFAAAFRTARPGTPHQARCRLLEAEARLRREASENATVRGPLTRATKARRAAAASGELFVDAAYAMALGEALEARGDHETAAFARGLARVLRAP